jgi:hypothetical protein
MYDQNVNADAKETRAVDRAEAEGTGRGVARDRS